MSSWMHGLAKRAMTSELCKLSLGSKVVHRGEKAAATPSDFSCFCPHDHASCNGPASIANAAIVSSVQELHATIPLHTSSHA